MTNPLKKYGDVRKERIDQLVTQKKRKGYIDRWLDKLRHDAAIRIFE